MEFKEMLKYAKAYDKRAMMDIDDGYNRNVPSIID